MKILITGSHFTPAQATIEELQKISDMDIIYVGRKHTREGDSSPSAESQVLPQMGVKFIPIVTGRLQRTLTPYTIPSLLKIPLGLIQSFYLISQEKPNVVLSFGGYVAVPVVISAWLLSIPIIIHEQTLVPGLANRISAYFADKIALTLKDNSLSSYNNTVLTGNPLRKELVTEDVKVNQEYRQFLTVAKKSKLPLIYITGGNQGSHIINNAVKDILPDLLKIAYVIHQCGDSKYNDFENLLKVKEDLEFPERYLLNKWIDSKDVGQIFRTADLVISRAGMNTLLEASFFAKPLVIIPIPVEEQLKNARYFKQLGNALVLKQEELNGENFLKIVKEALDGLEELEEKANKAKGMVIPEAASRLALETVILGKSGI